MKLADLPASMIEKIKTLRYDCILEKHEGPEDWASVLEYYDPEFMLIEGRHILLPVGQDRHSNISVLRIVVSADGTTLTLFLKDSTYVPDPTMEMFYAGRLAICEKMPDVDFFIATVYHEWFIVENEGLP